LKFSVSAFGKDWITLTKATFNNRFSWYDTTNAKLSVYKNSPTYANLLGSTALGVVTWDVIFTQNNLIDSWYVNTYVVIVEWIVYDSNARNQDWVVSMTDLITDSWIHFWDYANTGDFPLTEVK
jgi:hypothetical protein